MPLSRTQSEFSILKNQKINKSDRSGLLKALKLAKSKVTARATFSCFRSSKADRDCWTGSLERKREVTKLFSSKKFLSKFFLYFSPLQRCSFTSVCSNWNNILNTTGLLKNVAQIVDFLQMTDGERRLAYDNIINRDTTSIRLIRANNEDIEDFMVSVNTSTISGLCFQDCVINDGTVVAMLRKYSITEIEFLSCNNLTEESMWDSLTSSIVKLVSLDSVYLTDNAVEAIAESLPSLNYLHLQSYHMTDASLAYFRFNLHIRTLKLEFCWEITDDGVLSICQCLNGLNELSLAGCSKITDDSVEIISDSLLHLRSLNLSWCIKLTNRSLKMIAFKENVLEELYLDRCSQITNIGLKYLLPISTTLVTLSLRWCKEISDKGLECCSNFKHLKSLSLSGCCLITRFGLKYLIKLENLKELDVINCQALNSELLAWLKLKLDKCDVIC
ncbi:DgyrCDS4997 [Dimorphilus gyrociliatus]|uniref:DgyrCDS4997 n=1 Tax=Dimorphilus gyrociliatus TaxID=2664684 RepID=A0A7I8VK24_9ANNE|nr:DgyrCDS4997 [Dimorphilus gyrociliatus]